MIVAAIAMAALTQTAGAVTPRAAEDAFSPVGTSTAPVPRAQKTAAAEKKGAKASAGKRAGAQQRKANRKRRH